MAQGEDEGGSRYIIGIDLGTTNSAVAYVDTDKGSNPSLAIQPFRIAQATASGMLEGRPLLPSFYYLADGEGGPQGYVVGEWAKALGGTTPGRLVTSAKSWLCNAAAERKERILPIEAYDLSRRVSPVEVTAAYLRHIREGWDATVGKSAPDKEFSEQEVIITVPASFDEAARALTVEAATLAGYRRFVLLEEPLAAFYSWVQAHERGTLSPGQRIVVCDVGGGTTDFSLIDVIDRDGVVAFERVAVGDHLLLGGDNMDAALTCLLEGKCAAAGYPELLPEQRARLAFAARGAKEAILAGESCTSCSIVIQGGGSRVVADSWSVDLSASEVLSCLVDGFFGRYRWEEALALRRGAAIRTMGLPYAAEPSITKHLADFLARQVWREGARTAIDYILFNGGAMTPQPFQDAIIASLAEWGGKAPEVLATSGLDTAVSRGAAYYGKVRRGLGIRVHSGMPRTYYLAIEVSSEGGHRQRQALTIVPRGAEESFAYKPEPIFHLTPNAPTSFEVLTSHVRLDDTLGAAYPIDEETMAPLPPIHTVLKYGRRQADGGGTSGVPVQLEVSVTPLGILELALKAVHSDHCWRLEFQLAEGARASRGEPPALDVTYDGAMAGDIARLFSRCFSNSGDIPPHKVVGNLEALVGIAKEEWPTGLLRSLWPPLYASADKRELLSPAHEARWWNLAGYALRPGFGHALDSFYVKELWKVILGDMKGKKNRECDLQRQIAYRRIAGGLNKGQQMQLAADLLPTVCDKRLSRLLPAKGKQEAQVAAEALRTLASFELLDLPVKAALAQCLVDALVRSSGESWHWWALGRLAARHLLYGSLGNVLPAAACTSWVEALIAAAPPLVPIAALALVQMTKVTPYREVNLPRATVDRVAAWLQQDRDHGGRWSALLEEGSTLSEGEQGMLFGERLPTGLVLHAC